MKLRTDFVVELHELIYKFFIRVQFAPTLKSDSVDDEVRVYMLTVSMGADQYLPIFKKFRQLSCGEVCLRRIDFFSLGETLHQMIEPPAVILVVQKLCA